MEAKFLLKDKSQVFYDELEGIQDLNDKFRSLRSDESVPAVKIGGHDTIRERVDFNVARHKGAQFQSFKIEKRRGYNLAIFKL